MPNANAVAALAARFRVAMMSADVSANDRLACSIRSPRTSPTCHARTRGDGNDTIESLATLTTATESFCSVSASTRCASEGLQQPAPATSRNAVPAIARSPRC